VTDGASDRRAGPLRRLLTGAAIAAAVLVGLVLVLASITLGRCDAFGGRCPADRPPLIEDDVFGFAAVGAALAVAVPVFLRRPSRQRLLRAVGYGALAALLVGLMARSSAYGG